MFDEIEEIDARPLTTSSGFTCRPSLNSFTLSAGSSSGNMTPSTTYYYNTIFYSQYGNTAYDISTQSSFACTSSGSIEVDLSFDLANMRSNNVKYIGIVKTTGNIGYVVVKLAVGSVQSPYTYTDGASFADLSEAEQIEVRNSTTSTADSNQIIAGDCKFIKPIQESTTNVTIPSGATSQSTAILLTTSYNAVISSVSSGALILPKSNQDHIGLKFIIVNDSGETISVYPANGDSFRGSTANTPVTINDGEVKTMILFNGFWVSF